MPEYYIDVRNISDAMASLAFGTNHKIPVVVKNSGHDYKGRSAAPNSLALWTYNYKPEITLTKDFLPEGCTKSIANVVTFGAGEAWEAIYHFAEKHNITVPGGSSETVGAAGGWILVVAIVHYHQFLDLESTTSSSSVSFYLTGPMSLQTVAEIKTYSLPAVAVVEALLASSQRCLRWRFRNSLSRFVLVPPL